MPELPEVETIKFFLNKNIKNKIIKNIKILNHKTIDFDEQKFIENIINKKILNIKRRGKYLIFILTGNYVMLSHLRMEGKYILGKNKNDISKYAQIIFYFNDKTILNYDDSRTFGRITLKEKKKYLKIPPLSLLGKEANKKIHINEIYPLIHKSKKTIKEVLLNQHIISGLGNIYTDETLFKSKIAPLSDANILTINEIRIIIENAKKILNIAIKKHGCTIRSFRINEKITGKYQNYLNVYNKKNQKCLICNEKLVKIKINNRGTTYCPKCQKIKKKKYVIAIVGPICVGKTTALNEFKKNNYAIYSADKKINKFYKNINFKKKLIKLFKTDKKSKIRKIILNEKKQYFKLNNLFHPFIEKDIINFIKKTKKKKIAIEVPLFFEINLHKYVHEILLILSNKNVFFIKKRTKNKKKVEEQLKINNFIDFTKYKNKATFIIYNNDIQKKFIKKINKLINFRR